VTEKHPFTTTRRVLLASTSRHRRALLARLQIPFETESPEVDEARVCALGDRVLGKPGTTAANREMLAALAGQTATFHTAVAIVGIDAGIRQEHVDDTLCNFRPLSGAEIARHVELEPALDCAGGFKAESLGISLMSSVYSRDPTGLIGLPLIWVAEQIRPFLRSLD